MIDCYFDHMEMKCNVYAFIHHKENLKIKFNIKEEAYTYIKVYSKKTSTSLTKL